MIPLSVTALFPLVLFPVLHIAKAKEIASEYFNDGSNPWPPLTYSDLPVLRRLPDVAGDGEVAPGHAYRIVDHALLREAKHYAVWHHAGVRLPLHLREQHG